MIRLRSSLANKDGIVVNIGDGILDMMAYPYSDAFIGYTGVLRKKKAMEKAMLVVDSFAELIHILSSSS